MSLRWTGDFQKDAECAVRLRDNSQAGFGESVVGSRGDFGNSRSIIRIQQSKREGVLRVTSSKNRVLPLKTLQ